MGARGSIAADPPARAAVDAALAKGYTIDQIVAHLEAIGLDKSRSAVGRYTKTYAELAARQRDMRAVATAFASDFGQAGDNQTRLLIQLGTSLMTRHAMSMEEEDVDLDTKELMEFGRAVQSMTSAAKIDTDRDEKVREAARRQAKLDAAADAENAGRATGASEATLEAIRRKILGLAT